MPGAARPSPFQPDDPKGGPMLSTLYRRLREEDGATMVEYGIMLAFIASVAFLAVQAVGIGVFDIFSDPTLDLP